MNTDVSRPAGKPVASGSYEFGHQWRRVSYGPNAADGLGVELDRIGVRRPLVITTRSLVREGAILDLVLGALGRPASVFGEASQYAPLTAAFAAADLARSDAADGIVALGGGSVFGTAKGAAIALARGAVDPSEVLAANQLTDSPADAGGLAWRTPPPLQVALPTTNSGAEFTGIASLVDSNGGKWRYSDPAISPHTVVLDPRLTAATPPDLWASTGVKMLSDAIEIYYSLRSNPVLDSLALTAVEWFVTHLEASAAGDLDARLRCLIATWMTCFGTFDSGAEVGAGASLRQQLGPVSGARHGDIGSALLPHVLAFDLPAALGLQRRLAGAVGIDGADAGDEALGNAVIARVRALTGALDLPQRLSELGVERDCFEIVAERANGAWYTRSNIRRVESAADLAGILSSAY